MPSVLRLACLLIPVAALIVSTDCLHGTSATLIMVAMSEPLYKALVVSLNPVRMLFGVTQNIPVI